MTVFSNKSQTQITTVQNMISYEGFNYFIIVMIGPLEQIIDVYIHMKYSLVLYLKERYNQSKFIANH